MCKTKACPECSMLVPAHVVECTTNRCHYIFEESIPSVASIGRTYPAGTAPDFNGWPEEAILRHMYTH